MSRWLGPIAMLIVTALATHWAALHYAPGVIMDRTLATLKNRGIAEHAFTTPQRITPQSQAVVRSSPDLFYSLCRYDLSTNGESSAWLDVTIGEWPEYQSLSFFDAHTNNFATIRTAGSAQKVRMISSMAAPGEDAADIVSPTLRGVVLIRRLAPTQALFEEAKAASNADSCTMVQP